jgi:hypothetical protein
MRKKAFLPTKTIGLEYMILLYEYIFTIMIVSVKTMSYLVEAKI